MENKAPEINYTMDELVEELMNDQDWDVPQELREIFLPDLIWTLYTL